MRIPTNSCLLCQNNTFLINGQCVQDCPDGFFENVVTQQCSQCPPNCTKCNNGITNGVTCLQCNSNYFLNQSGNCEMCNTSCINCMSNANNCTGCALNTLYLDIVTGFCIKECNPGTYSTTNGTMMICQKCDNNCSNCSGEANNCTSCSSLEFLFLNQTTQNYYCNSCPTNDGYYLVNDSSSTNFSCNKCPSNCKICINALFDFCSECYEPYNLTSAALCATCNEQCQICDPSDFTKCLVCANSSLYADLSTGLCIDQCSNISYISNASLKQCSNCSENCASCNQSASNCSSCNNFNSLIYNSQNLSYECISVCPIGYFNESKLGLNLCSKCQNNCDLCNNSETCETCQNGYDKQNNTCCPMNYFSSANNECLPCNTTCLGCQINASFCISCQSPFLFFENQCFNDCPQHTYKNSSSTCDFCHSECLNCTGSDSDYCLSCYPGKYLFNVPGPSPCEPFCNQGFYTDNETNTCQKCDSSCDSCFDSHNTSCISCQMGFYLDKNNSCQLCDNIRCPNDCNSSQFFMNFTCVNQCSEKFFVLTNKICQECDSSCQTCDGSGKKSCLSCYDPYYLNDGACSLECHKNNNTRMCSPCHYSCETCQGENETQCTSCDNKTRELVNGTFNQSASSFEGSCVCISHYYDLENSPYCFGKKKLF